MEFAQRPKFSKHNALGLSLPFFLEVILNPVIGDMGDAELAFTWWNYDKLDTAVVIDVLLRKICLTTGRASTSKVGNI